MAICINCDGICFGTYSITPSPTGICINGVFSHQGTEIRPTQAQGSVSGYIVGGQSFPDSPVGLLVRKFSFSSGFSAVDGGELAESRCGAAGQSSSTHGYVTNGVRQDPIAPTCNTIDKFPFSSGTTSTEVGDTLLSNNNASGSFSSTHGYSAGGTEINKFPFASDTNATDVGELINNKGDRSGSGISSRTAGFVVGGSPNVNTIECFPFAADVPSTDYGEFNRSVSRTSCANSAEYGYISGGASSCFIDKFSFASSTDSALVGCMSSAREAQGGGQSSTTHGYIPGGYVTGGGTSSSLGDRIDSFPFAADAPATCIGNLAPLDAFKTSGNQV